MWVNKMIDNSNYELLYADDDWISCLKREMFAAIEN